MEPINYRNCQIGEKEFTAQQLCIDFCESWNATVFLSVLSMHSLFCMFLSMNSSLNHSAVLSNSLAFTTHFSLSQYQSLFQLKACYSMKCLCWCAIGSLQIVLIEMHFYLCNSASVSSRCRVKANNRSLRRIHSLLKWMHCYGFCPDRNENNAPDYFAWLKK